MSTVKLELQLSSQELLSAVEQLNESEFEEFVSQIIILHTQRKSEKLIKQEQEHLGNNNHNHNYDSHTYYKQPSIKATKQMTDDEYKELLRLSEQIDQLQAHRFEYLTALANLHGVSLTELMKSLGFQT
ncbi:MAG: STAS/SEC14 domain-containing protein [Nostocales cyanobacterium]|nr:MAG: STAS/SEC14 domain-containing protein [Nostocales cyanobacterium]TAF16368.1 MAG: STAS/SEC14 domain-containing protein [Nostocales cyanobacterium]